MAKVRKLMIVYTNKSLFTTESIANRFCCLQFLKCCYSPKNAILVAITLSFSLVMSSEYSHILGLIELGPLES